MENAMGYLVRFLVLCFFTSRVQSQSCYANDGTSLDESYIPCGSSDDVAACCLKGDFCLDDNACYNPSSGITYIAGCTDVYYESDSCPGKACTRAMAKCDDTNWVCCEGAGQRGDFPKSGSRDDCPCDAGFSTAISGISDLQATTSLPNEIPDTETSSTPDSSPSTPNLISIAATSDDTSTSTTSETSTEDVTTTTTISDDSTTTSSSTSTTTTDASKSKSTGSDSHTDTVTVTEAAPTSTATDATAQPVDSPTSSASSTITPSSGGMATGAKIGVGVGVPLAVALIAGLGILLFCLRRRRSREVEPVDQSTAVLQGDVSRANEHTLEDMGMTAYHDNANPSHYAPGEKQMTTAHTNGNGVYAPSVNTTASPPPQYDYSRVGTPQMSEGHR